MELAEENFSAVREHSLLVGKVGGVRNSQIDLVSLPGKGKPDMNGVNLKPQPGRVPPAHPELSDRHGRR